MLRSDVIAFWDPTNVAARGHIPFLASIACTYDWLVSYFATSSASRV